MEHAGGEVASAVAGLRLVDGIDDAADEVAGCVFGPAVAGTAYADQSRRIQEAVQDLGTASREWARRSVTVADAVVVGARAVADQDEAFARELTP